MSSNDNQMNFYNENSDNEDEAEIDNDLFAALHKKNRNIKRRIDAILALKKKNDLLEIPVNNDNDDVKDENTISDDASSDGDDTDYLLSPFYYFKIQKDMEKKEEEKGNA